MSSEQDSTFVATQTIWDFFNDPSYVRLIAGPIGSGKSVACCHDLMRLAMAQDPDAKGRRRTRTAIVRNTSDQLRATTFRTWTDWFGHLGYYKASDKTFLIKMNLDDGTTLDAEFYFLPLDTPDDVRKALSLELTFLWGNEWRELHPEVVDGLLMRLKRFPSKKDGGPTRSCAIFDTNMPDQSTWHFNKMEEPPENWSIFLQPPAIISFEEYFHQYNEEPNEEDGIVDPRDNEWYVNPDADNIDNLDPTYYPDIIPGKTEDFLNVYLRCRYGRSLAGLPVYEKTFSPDFHIAEKPFSPLKSESYPLIIGLDFGRTPAAVIGQRNTYGQLVVLDELTSENMGIETFLSRKLTPRLSEHDFIGCSTVIAPDPAGWAKQQIGEISPVDVIKQAGFQVIKPNSNDPERRIETVERVLLDHIDGKPSIVINPCCSQLIKGFRYGYKYKLNKQGVQDNKPMKDQFSHIHDAMQYFCMVAESNPSGSVQASRKRREVQTVSSSGWT